ncbi:MAG: cobalamin-dependent protein [Candidatus Paceibacterota bacterium]
MNKRRLLLVGRYHVIEPLGLICLASLAEALGFDVRVCLIKGSDFGPLFEEIVSFNPNLVGFSILTGYHQKAFFACDQVRKIGLPVVIGGPHATYFSKECSEHADYVVVGEGFRTFRRILQGELPPGVHFDPVRVAEGFPQPRRETLYRQYPELGRSSIKSITCSVGCPFACSYCYAPKYNAIYHGFALKLRPVDDVIAEAVALKKGWPPEIIYFQDDNFGLDLKWLEEFTLKWREQVALPWHCQIRLELARNERRLDLFRQAGCTGITVAIESGNGFLREFVLHRRMEEDVIYRGVKNIKDRGFTLRAEQILAVPFSDIATDLETLRLNCELGPEMAWTSILVPYGGTEMGEIVSNFGLYCGNNDDLHESFFDRSVLRHCLGGRELLAPLVQKIGWQANANPLLKFQAISQGDGSAKIVSVGSDLNPDLPIGFLGEIQYLDPVRNNLYSDQTVILQRLFYWLGLVPLGDRLGARITNTPVKDWTWVNLGALAKEHLDHIVGEELVCRWIQDLADSLGCCVADLPRVIKENPLYFVFFAGGPDLAKEVSESGLFEGDSLGDYDELSTLTRRHVFETTLYRIRPAASPIATRVK